MSKSSDRQQQMFSLIESYLESRMTQAAFCEQHGMLLSRFQYWLKKHRQSLDPAPGGFVRLLSSNQANAAALVPGCIILRYPNGVSLQLSAGTPLSTIRSLLSLI